MVEKKRRLMRSAAGLERRWRRFKKMFAALTEMGECGKERVKVREDRLKEIESLSIFDSQPEALTTNDGWSLSVNRPLSTGRSSRPEARNCE